MWQREADQRLDACFLEIRRLFTMKALAFDIFALVDEIGRVSQCRLSENDAVQLRGLPNVSCDSHGGG
jgi:hypothetical protein